MRIRRRKTRQVRIGNVKIGGTAPISIQSMVKTETGDIKSTINEIRRLQKAGCQIVRVAVKRSDDLYALNRIKKGVDISLVADIHFNYTLALGAIDQGADGIRLNPGNIYKKEEVKRIIQKAKKTKIPIRIGVNSGSLRIRNNSSARLNVRYAEDESMVKSALRYIKYFERLDFRDIIISLKSSNVLSTISAYRKMANFCDYPFHLGVTATGLKEDGIIKSVTGIGSLLSEGIGDTIRVSLTSDSILEVEVAKSILQSLGLRSFGPEIISCPTCGRCQVNLVRIVENLHDKLSAISYQSSAKKIAIMGCEVNGPGEARHVDVGIAAGKGSGVLFKKGRIIKRVKEDNFVNEIMREIKLTAES